MNATPSLSLLFAVAAPIAAQTFTVVGLPDTQRYSELYPAIYQSQTQWITAQAAALSIRYVSHYGDVAQHGDSLAEWHNADVAMATLDAAGIPYGVTAGNHDIPPSAVAGSSYIPANFRTCFGAQRFAGNHGYRGDSPSGMSSYQLFDAHGVQFLALHFECDAALRELEWAQGILHESRDKPVLPTTHRYLQDAQDYTGGVPLVPSGRYPDIWYGVEGLYTPDGIRSESLWNWFVRRNPDILLVQCGHFHEEFRQTSTNAYGNPVHEVLADHQDDPDGAVEVGYERLAELQEEILWLCEAAHVPVVSVTQGLDGMARTGMPTRAEVTDAAMGGRAECVMRNEGPFVVETAEFLARLLLRMQDHSHEKRSLMRRLRIAGPARTDPPTRTDTSAPA